MELQFLTNTTAYLAEVFYETISQEETGEAIVPDSYPDVERILDCSGTVVLRAKENQQISGAILATAMYAPEDFGAPKTLDYYIPFQLKCPTAPSGVMVDCQVRSIDARMLNSRKVLVRVHLAGCITGYGQEQEEQFEYVSQPEEDLELKTNSYGMLRPVELGEKAFTVSDELELPSGYVSVEDIAHYQVIPLISEAKILGNKGVFKGNLAGKILYQSQETLHSWSFDLPFSQYVEFDRDYDQDELQVVPMVTDIQVDTIGANGCLVHCQILAQCCVMGKSQLEVVEDAYSLGHEFLPQWKILSPTSRLNHQTFSQVGRYTAQCPAKEVIHTQCWLGTPVVFQRNQQREIIVPVTSATLYVDDQGQTQCHSGGFEVKFDTEMWEDCICRPTVTITGEALALLAGDGMEIRCPMTLDVETWSQTQLQTLCGGELAEPLNKKIYPSVILRPVTEEDTLWSVAKGCRTTGRAIREANQMGEGEEILKKMLLIPIVK